MRRALIIIASIIFLAGIAFGVWFFFLAPKGPSLTTTDGNTFGTAPDAELSGEDSRDFANGPIPAGEEVSPRLIRITENPVVAGLVAFPLPSQAVATDTPATPGDTEIRYIDRASGNIYAYRVHERTLARISNRTLPGIQDAAWLSDGSMAFVRFLAQNQDSDEVVETYALPAGGEGGYFLEKGLGQVSVAGTTTLMTLLQTTAGSIASTARVDGTNPRTLFSSPLSSLVVHLSNGPFMANTKASAHIDGYTFTIGSTGAFTRILGPLRGLTTLPSPSGNLIIFSFIENRALKLSVLDRRDGSIIAIPIATIADKCVWGNGETIFYCGVPSSLPADATLPDDWYQGAVSFSDRLWEVDLSAKISSYLVDPKREGGIAVDITNLAIDGLGDVLTFRNRLDGSLWAFDL